MVRCPAHCPQARLSARQVKLAVAVAVPMVAAMCLSAAGLSVIGSVIMATVTLEVVAAVVIVVAVRLRLRQPRQAATPASGSPGTPAITTGQKAIVGRVVSPEDARAALYDEMAPVRRP